MVRPDWTRNRNQSELQAAVQQLITWSTAKSTPTMPYKIPATWGPPVAERANVSTGVWKNSRPLSFVVEADSISDARDQLSDALRKQAGIVAKIMPDRTLQIRLETGDNDPVVPARDFTAAPVADVINYLDDITGMFYFFRSAMPRGLPPGATPAGPDPDLPEQAGRSMTLHLESGPVSKVSAQVLAALAQQDEIISDATDDPWVTNLRLSADAAAKVRYTLQLKNSPVPAVVHDCLQSFMGKTIAFSPQSFRGAAPITLSIDAVPLSEAIKKLRDAIEQQAGIVLDEQPDGNFTARRIATPTAAKSAPAGGAPQTLNLEPPAAQTAAPLPTGDIDLTKGQITRVIFYSAVGAPFGAIFYSAGGAPSPEPIRNIR
jgi:hypothetical protein